MDRGLTGKVSVEKTWLGRRIIGFEFRLGTRKKIGARKKGEIFVPLSRGQWKKLRAFRRKVPEEDEPGYATLKAWSDTKTLVWQMFYPLGEVFEKRVNPPKRKGIGALMHHAITEYLAKHRRFKTYSIRHESATKEREDQLRAMGIDPNRTYGVGEYRDIVRRYAEKKFRKR